MGTWKASRFRLPGRPSPVRGSIVRRVSVGGLGWLLAAVVATLIGIGAIRLVGAELTSTPSGVLTDQDVAAELSARPSGVAPTSTAASPPSVAPTSTAAGEPVSFSVTGGSAVAVCEGGRARLMSWSPNQGYAVDRAEQGPAARVEVRFDAGHGRDSRLRITCSGGVPITSTDD